MARNRKAVLQRALALLVIAFGKLTLLLPLSASRALTRALGRLAYYVIPRIRKVGMANLDLAYGDSLPRAEKIRILRSAVDNVAMVAAEFSRMPRLYAQGFSGLVRVEGMEHIDKTKGFLAIGGHLGNWEWMASVMVAYGFRTAEVVRPFDDRLMDAAIDGTRRGGGIVTIPKDDAAREIVRKLKEGYIVGVLIDQCPRENAVPAVFFGAPCWATIAPAIIAARTKAPIHPVFMIRDADGRYTLRFYPAMDLVHSGHMRQDLQENTQRCQTAFEQIVRENPGQWLWFHRRWKERGRLEREWSARMQGRAGDAAAAQ